MKVLIVEDDRKIASAVRRGLQAEGFTVEIASDGLEGRWMAIEGGYDLVILDLMLPGRNGFQVCADLRAAGVWIPDPHPHRQGRRVGRSGSARHRGRRLPHQAVLLPRARRPGPRVAAPRVRRSAGACHGRRPAHRAGGPPGVARRLRRSISPAASSTSWSSSCAAPARCTRSATSSPVCGSSTTRVTRTSSRCTYGRLRRKLDEPFGVDTITTVRGAGYRIDAHVKLVPSTVRWRVTAAATAAIVVVLVAVGWGLVVNHRRELTNSLDERLSEIADVIAADVRAGRDPDVAPARRGRLGRPSRRCRRPRRRSRRGDRGVPRSALRSTGSGSGG